jgi:hypothetical protein
VREAWKGFGGTHHGPFGRKKKDLVGYGGPVFAAEEGECVTGQLFLVIEELSPDLGGGGEIREGIPECLHGEPAVVADVLERVECRVPGDAARSRHAPVVFGNVHVTDAAPRAPDGGRRILFLDMGVERIQVDLAVGVTHTAQQSITACMCW